MLLSLNEANQTVVELIARNFALFESVLDSDLLLDYAVRLGFSWPESISYEAALVHHIIASAGNTEIVTLFNVPDKRR